MAAARNAAIVLALGAAVYFVPGGGTGASIVYAVVSTLILVSFVLLAARLYREHLSDLYGLGDVWRGLLYGAIGVAVLAMAARPRLFETSVGTLVWVALIGAASYVVYLCWRRYREYA
jgi:drug/metabolite transporter (DMT)-like permease